MPVGEVMEETSSTDFIRWNKYLDDKDWHEHSKSDHQMAQIAFHVHAIGRMLSGNKQKVEFDDYLVKFKSRDGVESPTKKVYHTEEVREEARPEPELRGATESETRMLQIAKKHGLKVVEVADDGSDLPDHLRVANAKSKALWGSLLGVKDMPKAGESLAVDKLPERK